MSHLSNKHKPDYSLIAIIFILVVFGLAILTSATLVVGYNPPYNDTYFFFKHQFFYGFLPGLFLFFICSRINYKFWQKNAVWLLITTFILLILVFVPKIGFELNKAKSWINLGIFSFQPSEVMKLSLIIYLSAWFAKSKEHIKSISHGFLPFLILLAIISGLIALQPDIGTMIIVAVIAVGVYFIAGLKWPHLFGLIFAGSGLLFFLIKFDSEGSHFKRILSFINPNIDTQGVSYHISQALIAIGSGGLFGLGFGRSRQRFGYLPEVQGDSIFAIMAEELGFVLSTLFIFFLVYLIIKILKLSAVTSDDFARFFSAGLAIWIGGQTFINIGAMIGILPLTGVPLPFVSHGGTALLSLLAACGILINISKCQN